MNSVIYSHLRSLIIPTVRMLLYTDCLDIDSFLHSLNVSKLTVDEMLATRCGNTSDGIHYLLNFSNPTCIDITKDIFSDKAYIIELQEFASGLPTKIGHAMVYIDGMLIDSYVGNRELTCRLVGPKVLQKLLLKLSKSSEYAWFELTNYQESITGTIDVLVYEYEYTTSILGRFKDLIVIARHRLNEEEIGQDDGYLFLLNDELDMEKANDYLDYLDTYTETIPSERLW